MDRHYWTEDRQKLFEWITINGSASFADLYKGAVINLWEKIPGHVRFVSHAARDLMNGMPAHKLGLERQQVQYVQIVRELQLCWNDGSWKRLTPTSMEEKSLPETRDVPAHITVPIRVIEKIELLLVEHEKGNQRRKESSFRFFEAFMPKSDAMKQAAVEFAATWLDLQKWFQATAHQGSEPPSVVCLNTIRSRFEQLESIMLAVADRPRNTIGRIDEILDQANERSD